MCLCLGPPKKEKKNRYLKLHSYTSEVIRSGVGSRLAANLANAFVIDLDMANKLNCDKDELLIDKSKIDREKDHVKGIVLKSKNVEH